ncbi:MAG: hypothetical protein ACI9SY_000566 [Candidatus Paceibacteria bacterium]|jgi:hypothetical protein
MSLENPFKKVSPENTLTLAEQTLIDNVQEQVALAEAIKVLEKELDLPDLIDDPIYTIGGPADVNAEVFPHPLVQE